MSSGRLLRLGAHIHNRDVNCFFTGQRAQQPKLQGLTICQMNILLWDFFTLLSYLSWNKTKTGYLVLQINLGCVRILSPHWELWELPGIWEASREPWTCLKRWRLWMFIRCKFLFKCKAVLSFSIWGLVCIFFSFWKILRDLLIKLVMHVRF